MSVLSHGAEARLEVAPARREGIAAAREASLEETCLDEACAEEVCSVRVGGSLFGVPIRSILEIVGSAHPRPVPLAPAFIGGLVRYRGDVLATVSLRHLLGLPPTEDAQDVLVMEGEGGSFGLLVDAVVEVLTVARTDYETNPSILDEHCKSLLAGAYKLKDNLLVMLDLARLDPLHIDPLHIGQLRSDPQHSEPLERGNTPGQPRPAP